MARLGAGLSGDNGKANRSPASFRRGAALMIMGSIGSQGLLLLAMLLLSRFYSPAAIGVQALFLAIVGVLTVVSTLRLDLAVVLAKTPERADEIQSVAAWQSLVVAAGALVYAALVHLPSVPASFPGSGSGWIWMVPPAVILSSAVQMGFGRATLAGRFGVISASNVAMAAVFLLGVVGFALEDSPLLGPVWTRTVGFAVAAVLLLIVLGAPRWTVWLPEVGKLRRVWATNRQFLIFNTPYSLVGATARDLPIYVFSVAASSGVVAAYALARTITMAPISLFSSAVSSVFYREAAEHLGTPRLERLAGRMTLVGLTLSLPGFAYLMAWGDQVFEFVFGEKWTLAGHFSQILALPLWLALQNGWPDRMFEAAGRQRLSFAIQMGFDSLHAVGVLTMFAVTADPKVAVAAYAVTLTLHQLTYLTAIFRVGRFAMGPLINTLAGSLVAFLTLMGVMLLVRHVLGEDAQVVGALLSLTAVIALTAAVGWYFVQHPQTDPT